MTNSLTVYSHPASQPSRTVFWVCLMNDLAFKLGDTRSADRVGQSQTNPRGQVSSIVDDGFALAENYAFLSASYSNMGRAGSTAAIENPDGTKVRLSHLEGKVVLVDFWAAWCRPCLDELSYLKELDHELGGADFEILGVDCSGDLEDAVNV